MSAKTKKILKIVLNAVLWLFLAFSVFMTIIAISAANSDDGLPSIGGKAYISVLSDSMNPTFKKGDLIVCEKLTSTQKAELVVGDVITYKADLNGDGTANDINTHRIVEVVNDGGNVYYKTQGDNTVTNPNVDTSLVHYSEVLAKYTDKNIGGLGSVLTYLRSPSGFMVCVVIPLAIFFLYELYSFIATIIKAKVKKEITPKEEDEIKKRAVEEYLKQQAAAAEVGKAEEKTEAPVEDVKTSEKTEVPTEEVKDETSDDNKDSKN